MNKNRRVKYAKKKLSIEKTYSSTAEGAVLSYVSRRLVVLSPESKPCLVSFVVMNSELK